MDLLNKKRWTEFSKLPAAKALVAVEKKIAASRTKQSEATAKLRTDLTKSQNEADAKLQKKKGFDAKARKAEKLIERKALTASIKDSNLKTRKTERVPLYKARRAAIQNLKKSHPDTWKKYFHSPKAKVEKPKTVAKSTKKVAPKKSLAKKLLEKAGAPVKKSSATKSTATVPAEKPEVPEAVTV